jgi:hypothetical protein
MATYVENEATEVYGNPERAGWHMFARDLMVAALQGLIAAGTKDPLVVATYADQYVRAVLKQTGAFPNHIKPGRSAVE